MNCFDKIQKPPDLKSKSCLGRPHEGVWCPRNVSKLTRSRTTMQVSSFINAFGPSVIKLKNSTCLGKKTHLCGGNFSMKCQRKTVFSNHVMQLNIIDDRTCVWDLHACFRLKIHWMENGNPLPFLDITSPKNIDTLDFCFFLSSPKIAHEKIEKTLNPTKRNQLSIY